MGRLESSLLLGEERLSNLVVNGEKESYRRRKPPISSRRTVDSRYDVELLIGLAMDLDEY